MLYSKFCRPILNGDCPPGTICCAHPPFPLTAVRMWQSALLLAPRCGREEKCKELKEICLYRRGQKVKLRDSLTGNSALPAWHCKGYCTSSKDIKNCKPQCNLKMHRQRCSSAGCADLHHRCCPPNHWDRDRNFVQTCNQI